MDDLEFIRQVIDETLRKEKECGDDKFPLISRLSALISVYTPQKYREDVLRALRAPLRSNRE